MWRGLEGLCVLEERELEDAPFGNPDVADAAVTVTDCVLVAEQRAKVLTAAERAEAKKLAHEYRKYHTGNPLLIDTPEKAQFLILKGYEKVHLLYQFLAEEEEV